MSDLYVIKMDFKHFNKSHVVSYHVLNCHRWPYPSENLVTHQNLNINIRTAALSSHELNVKLVNFVLISNSLSSRLWTTGIWFCGDIIKHYASSYIVSMVTYGKMTKPTKARQIPRFKKNFLKILKENWCVWSVSSSINIITNRVQRISRKQLEKATNLIYVLILIDAKRINFKRQASFQLLKFRPFVLETYRKLNTTRFNSILCVTQAGIHLKTRDPTTVTSSCWPLLLNDL